MLNYVTADSGHRNALKFIDFGNFEDMELPFQPDMSCQVGYQFYRILQDRYMRSGMIYFDYL